MKTKILKILKILLILAILIQTISCANKPAPVVEASEQLEAQVPQIDMAAELAKIDTLLKTDSPSAPVAHESFLRALRMMEDEKTIFAELFLKRALANDPASHFLLSELIKNLLRQNKGSEAFPLLKLAVQSPKATGDDFLFMARLYKESKNLDSAEIYYKKAADKMSSNLGVLYEYAQLLEFLQNYAELKRIYDILLSELDFPPRLVEKQLSLYSATDTPDSVVANLLGEAFKANGMQYAEYGYFQAEILASLKKYSEANEILLTLFFAHPSKEFTSKLALRIAYIYELMDSITVAVIWYEQLLAREPENHVAMNNLGYMLIDRDIDIARGMAFVDEALSLSPGNPAYLDSKAWGLYKTGKYEEALQILEKLATDGVDVNEVWDHLAKVCDALKLTDKAKEYRARRK
jgi:predicted Zn-dependent protease